MYRVLIVEDEIVERELLEDLLENGYPQIDKIYTADNGIDALRLAQKKKPDVVLIDINIPGISGLELMEELYQNRFGGKVLFTTAYDSFDYAVQAMKYGAAGYLLKPVMDDELREYLEKCFDMIERDRKKRQLSSGIESICSYAQRYLIRDFFQGRFQESAMINAYGWPRDGELQARILWFQFGEEPSTQLQNEMILSCQDAFLPYYHILLSTEGTWLCMMLQPRRREEHDRMETAVWIFAASVVRRNWQNLKLLWVDTTPVCSSYGRLWESWKAMIENGGKISRNASGWEDLIMFDPLPVGGRYKVKELKNRIQKAVWHLREGKPERALGVFRGFFECKAQETWGVFYVLKALTNCDEELDISEGFLAAEGDNPQKNLLEWLEENQTVPTGKTGGMRAVIEEAWKIMEQEYASVEMSQTLVAERLGLNSAYFSRLFKKETGEKFITAMTRIRMKHAGELLDNGVPPEKAGIQCGYGNKKYFYETFKNYYGVSALHYHQRGKDK